MHLCCNIFYNLRFGVFAEYTMKQVIYIHQNVRNIISSTMTYVHTHINYIHGKPILLIFFKRETATPINQEARILDFVGSLPRNNLSMRTPFIFVHYAHAFRCTIPRRLKEISNFCLYIYSPRISIDMNTQWARFARHLPVMVTEILLVFL